MTTSLLIHGGEADASTTIVDVLGNVIANTGIVYDNGQSKFSTTSLRLDGSDYFDIIGQAAILGRIFTLDQWVFPTNGDIEWTLWDNRNGGGTSFIITGNGTGNMTLFVDGATRDTTPVPAQNVWSFLRITYDGITFRVALNGTEVMSYAAVLNLTAEQIRVGHNFTVSGINGFTGNMEEIQITRGQALSITELPTAAFANPAAPTSDPYFALVPLLLHFDEASGNFVNSSDFGTITVDGASSSRSASAKFGAFALQGAANEVTAATGDADLRLDGIDFTIEGWFFLPSAPTGTSHAVILDRGGQAGSTFPNYRVVVTNALTLEFTVGSGTGSATGFVVLDIGSVPTGVYVHFAWSKANGNEYFFIDGALVHTRTAVAMPVLASAPLNFGNDAVAGSAQFFPGRIDDIRLTRGAGQYIAQFPVPTTAFLNVGPGDEFFDNVELLLHLDGANGFSGPFLDSSNNAAIVTAQGNAVLTTTDPKWPTASIDIIGGVGDYIQYTGIPAPGVGDFCLEDWLNTPSSASSQLVFDMRPVATQGVYISLYIDTAGKLRFLTDSLDRIVSTTSVNDSVWHHVALVRISGITRLFIDGIQEGVDYTDANSYLTSANGLRMGNSGFAPSSPLEDKMDDIRITYVDGRYTENFVPPVAPFPNFALGTAPVITVQPIADSVALGDTASFSVTATTESGTLTYQWHETTAGALAGETNSTLLFVTQLGDNGNGYFVEVSNDVGTTTSTTAALTVDESPIIITFQPNDKVIVEGNPVVFAITAVAVSFPPLTYQWYEQTQGILSGQTNTTLSFIVSTLNNNDGYYCIVSDANSNFLQSNTASLMVLREEDESLMNFIVQARRDLAINWTEVNPILVSGEIGIELDTQKFKYGDGINTWKDLPYWGFFRPEVKTITTTTYTLQSTDEWAILLFTNVAGCVITGPAAVSDKLPVGFLCHLAQQAASPGGQISFVAETPATTQFAVGNKTRAQFSSLSIILDAADIYKIIGDAEG